MSIPMLHGCNLLAFNQSKAVCCDRHFRGEQWIASLNRITLEVIDIVGGLEQAFELEHFRPSSLSGLGYWVLRFESQ